MAQYGFSYLQSVTKNLALGVDFLYLGRPPYPGAPPFSSLTAGLRYSTARDVCVGVGGWVGGCVRDIWYISILLRQACCTPPRG